MKVWFILIFPLLLFSACTSPGYNDNPSQQISEGNVGCWASTGFFSVYFNLHLQPADSQNKESVNKELFRRYCNQLPAPGLAFLTVDLVNPELRKIPMGIRIVEQKLTGFDEANLENFETGRILLEWSPKVYPKGSIESSVVLEQAGYYAIQLSKGEGFSPVDTLLIPIKVGTEPAPKTLMLGFGVWVIGLTILAVFVLSRWQRLPAKQE